MTNDSLSTVVSRNNTATCRSRLRSVFSVAASARAEARGSIRRHFNETLHYVDECAPDILVRHRIRGRPKLARVSREDLETRHKILFGSILQVFAKVPYSVLTYDALYHRISGGDSTPGSEAAKVVQRAKSELNQRLCGALDSAVRAEPGMNHYLVRRVVTFCWIRLDAESSTFLLQPQKKRAGSS